MSDGDYERGRSREIGAIAAELKRLKRVREKVPGASSLVFGAELKHKDGCISNAPSTKDEAPSTREAPSTFSRTHARRFSSAAMAPISRLRPRS